MQKLAGRLDAALILVTVAIGGSPRCPGDAAARLGANPSPSTTDVTTSPYGASNVFD
jgi:hypothetical protein